jgi:hypothetical protein
VAALFQSPPPASLLLSSVLTGIFGEKQAKRIGDMKELSEMEGKDLSLDSKVDLINNAYGRFYATSNDINMSDLMNSSEKSTNFLNGLAVYTLKSIPEYANDPAYSNIINGKEKIFSQGSISVNTFMNMLQIIISHNQDYVTPANKE